MLNKASAFLVLGILVLTSSLPAYSWPVSLTVSSGDGDEATYKRGLFGNKRTTVKDRIGDKFESKRGIFGVTHDEELSLLGNGVKHHRGILGNSETDAHTMLGDTVQYKKNIFGWKNANVDLHGMSSYLNHTLGKPANPASGPLTASPTYSPNINGRFQPQTDSSLSPGSLPVKRQDEDLPLK